MNVRGRPTECDRAQLQKQPRHPLPHRPGRADVPAPGRATLPLLAPVAIGILAWHGLTTDHRWRDDIGKINEPKAQALFETTAEVCSGLATAYQHYEQKEPAWQR